MAYYDMANYMTPEEAGAFDINTVRADVAVGKSRLVGVNLWRIITDHPNEASPLAICDNETMARADAVKIGALPCDALQRFQHPRSAQNLCSLSDRSINAHHQYRQPGERAGVRSAIYAARYNEKHEVSCAQRDLTRIAILGFKNENVAVPTLVRL